MPSNSKAIAWDIFWRWKLIWEWKWIIENNWRKRKTLLVECMCWNIKDVEKHTITSWKSKSCWCLQKEICSNIWKITWPKNIKNAIWWNRWLYWEKNPSYKWNTRLIQSIRNSDEYIKWRTNCFLRDNYSCQISWIKWDIIVHHLTPISKLVEWYDIYTYRNNKELFNIENWITISRELHNIFHNIYWKKESTIYNFYDFVEKIFYNLIFNIYVKQ